MTGEDVLQVFEAILPHQERARLCAQFGVIERQRKRPLGRLVRAMVIAAGTPGGAYQGDVLRSYLEFAVPRVARSAFYRWLTSRWNSSWGLWPTVPWPMPGRSRSI
jgi:hypothetical protein